MTVTHATSHPSASTSTEDRRRHPYISTILSPTTHKIVATANARVYHKPFANFRNPEWTYSKIKGLLVFGRDLDVNGDKASIAQGTRLSETYWFRLVDVSTDRVVWMLRLPELFEYHKDRPFFHVFSGSSRMFGFCFDDDEEAAIFYAQVTGRTGHPKDIKSRSGKSTKSSKQTKRDKALPLRPGRVDPTTISAPAAASFVHVGHVGFDSKGAVEASKDIDPAWTALLQGLQGYGITQNVVADNIDFVEGFLAGAKVGRTNTDPTSATTPEPSKPPEKRKLFRRKTAQS